MQHTTGVAVLATELPATDRRALSQAWYSALHLAERAPRARSAPPTPPAHAHARRVAALGTAPPPRAAAGARGAAHATAARGVRAGAHPSSPRRSPNGARRAASWRGGSSAA